MPNRSHFFKLQAKSPMIFLLVLAILVVSTLVVGSYFFLQPNIEQELKGKITEKIDEEGVENTQVKLSGRDVTIRGSVESKAEASKVEALTREVQGVREIKNQLLIKKQTSD